MSSKTSNQLWVSHPTGNTFSRALIDGLERSELLDTFHTCIGIGSDNTSQLAAQLLGQRRCPIPQAKIQTQPARELLRLISQRAIWAAGLRKHESGPLCVDRIYHKLDKTVAQRLKKATVPPTGIYAYEDGALASFQAAKQLGVARLYDLPIGYWRTARRIQMEEAERHPEWAETMPALRDSDAKLGRKDEELQLSEHIYVASQFTASTLQDAPFSCPTPTIVPYGCPPARNACDLAPRKANQPLKVLFVGSLSQRKGLADLLDAVNQVGNKVELTIIGRRVADCKPLDAALNQHRWIESLPHAEILQIMRTHDVLVFPSLFEGFGLVLTEALSQGIPIISTTHTAAPDLIEDGKEGFIVPIRSSEGIAAKLLLLSEDSDRLHGMSEAALKKAQTASWEAYQRGMVDALRPLLTATVN